MDKLIRNYLMRNFEKNRANQIICKATENYKLLEKEAKYQSESQRAYLEKSIIPAVAVYRALQDSSIYKEKAYDYLEDMIGNNTKNTSRKMWVRLGKLPFFYGMFKSMFAKGLSKDSWAVEWIKNDKNSFEYNITRCLWNDKFAEYRCPELCAIFCRNDEINFENVSKYMCFERTSALGYGADCCDFHFYSTKP